MELVLRNLAEAHNGLHPDVTYGYLMDQFVDVHVRDWSFEPCAMGKIDTTACDDALITC